ncbi:MAG: hypothetical protein LQ339_004315 [Xanthoria mediterranea]|nr:MAG: hypothetical protein LQ339_004315 [Xanthoria mediterranea]
MPGVIKRTRYHGHAPHQQKHYFANGTWHHPYDYRPSCYSDFVPCSYDEKTVVARIYNYVRTLLAQTNGTSLHQRRFPPAAAAPPSTHTCSDIEMISTSPSPTLCAHPTVTTSPRSLYHRPDRSRDGSYRTSKLTATTTSPRSYIRPPPAAAFVRQPTQSPLAAPNPHKRPRPVSAQSFPSASVTAKVDAATQYSPPLLPTQLEPVTTRAKGKRRGASSSPEEAVPQIPPEPPLAPQMSVKRTGGTTSWADTNSSATLVKDPSAPTTSRSSAAPTTTIATAPSSQRSSQGSSPKRPRPAKSPPKTMPAETQYETCDTKDLVLLISNMLTELVRFNDDIPLKDGRLTRFHSRAPPGISIKDYLQRLTTHATLSPPILLSMVYYIDKLCALYPAFTISSLTVHRFLITSATVASKGLSDSFWTNSLYARVGGVSLKELALLELEFLWRVEWRIVPRPETLRDYYRSLVERSEGYRIEGGNSSSSSNGSSRAGSEKAAGSEKGGSERGGGSESGGSAGVCDGQMDRG